MQVQLKLKIFLKYSNSEKKFQKVLCNKVKDNEIVNLFEQRKQQKIIFR